ncbi:unnamed protein product [Chilo suppressalis]|uniref:Pre-rRNA-processing protein RIX1 N-terminal domain-containing protein n=1 Tax=Chilo suppressalis TaxID=168631 RepID=A0ABN8AZ53_CHISP|nr:unnamed protein product [Chilo suppressalis]
MSHIFKKLHDVDPNNPDAIKDVLTTFFQGLSKYSETSNSKWLRALENIITRYPKYCSSHRNTIEEYLSNFVESTDDFIVIEAAKCAHAIQQVRPPQEKTATAKNCWREHLIVLCNVAHKLISKLFPNTVDMYKNVADSQKPLFESTSTSPLYTAFTEISSPTTQNNIVNKEHILSTKLKNVLIFLQAALVEIYPVAKPIQPQLILQLLVRALSVSSGSKINLDQSTVASIKIQALRTIDALSACLGSNLIPFSALIFKIAIQTLQWCTDNPNEESRKVRCAAYNSLARWLRRLKTHRIYGDSTAGRSWEETLTTNVIADITPARHLVQLTLNPQSTKNLSKKAKRRLANTMLQESSIAAHAPGEKNKTIISEATNDEVAIAALDFAETFILVCGLFFKPTTCKMLQERLVKECYNCDNHSLERSLSLLRALEALRKGGPSTVAPPTQYCLQLYSKLINSEQDQISRFCSEALLNIKMHLHCAPPSLSFALESQEKEKESKKRKKISEKNRAALAALLGKQRMPAEDNDTEEIIDISDEPTNKKTRTSTEMDKISVSSDSDDAMVIEDDVDEGEAINESPHNNDNNESSSEEIELVVEVDLTSNTHDKVTKDLEIQEVTDSNGKDVTNVENCEDDNVQVAETSENAAVTEENVVTDTRENVTQKSSDTNIHDLATQIPLNVSNDTVDNGRSPLSMEVSYDFPSTGKEKVTILDKIEDENLPSTNETDDIQITCGQVVVSSQDVEVEKIKENGVNENVEIKLNGDKTPEKELDTHELVESGTEKISAKDVNVDDMLADFVDEVVEENVTNA